MDEERRKKIEAGRKLSISLLQKKSKIKKLNMTESLTTISDCQKIDEEEAHLNNEKLLTQNCQTLTGTVKAEVNPDRESSLNQSEGSDDASHLVNADFKLPFLYEQKFMEFKLALENKDIVIQKLARSLEGTMERCQESENSHQQINLLQQQLKNVSKVLEKQRAKEFLDPIQANTQTDFKKFCEIGVQLEPPESLCRPSITEESVEETLSICSEMPNFIKEISNILNKHTSEAEAQDLLNKLKEAHLRIPEDSLTPDQASGDQVHLNTVDIKSVLKRIEILNAVTKLIESLVGAAIKYPQGTPNDFYCSKFQSFFLKRINSGNQDELDNSENETCLPDINYAEVGQSECEKSSSVKIWSEHSSIERLRNHVSAGDFSMVTGFLQEEIEKLPLASTCEDTITKSADNGSDEFYKFDQQKLHLEARLKNIKKLNQDLQESERVLRHRSVDSDTLTNFEGNILEEPPLSCTSLISLTDSEYKNECATDSESNFSRKISLDTSRHVQNYDMCSKCEKYLEVVRDKYDDHLCIFKETIENNLTLEKTDAVQKLENDMEHLKQDNNSLCEQLDMSCSEWDKEKTKWLAQIESLDNDLKEANKKIHDILIEKAEIAESVQEHQQDLKDLRAEHELKLNDEQKKFQADHLASIELLKEAHQKELDNIKFSYEKTFEDAKTLLFAEHARNIGSLGMTQCGENTSLQKKVEQLQEEKCVIVSETTQKYEAILRKNHKVLIRLCNHLCSKMINQKNKLFNESQRSSQSNADLSYCDALDELNKNVEHGILKFLIQSYFQNSEENDIFNETEYLTFEIGDSVGEKDMLFRTSENPKKINNCQPNLGKETHSEGTFEPEDMMMIHSEINNLREEFQKDAAMYEEINSRLHQECKAKHQQIEELEERMKDLKKQLDEKEIELSSKESQLAAVDANSAKGGLSSSQLSSSDIKTYQDAAQTSSQLIRVLSDLVKTFMDIERDINSYLVTHGLIPPQPGMLAHHEDETGHSVGSREDFTSMCAGECPNLELAEDGPDLTPRAWDMFSAVGTYDHDMEGEDVILYASRRLKLAVDHVLNLLTQAIDNSQLHQEEKLLKKRYEELSKELHDECVARDNLQMELVTEKNTIRKLEAEKNRLEDLNCELKENVDNIKRELCLERNKVFHLMQEKETAFDEIQNLKNNCELLASRLGDPEQKLLQENSRLSNEKHTAQKNLTNERQSFRDRLHQMEAALEELNSEKDEIVEKSCKAIRDLKAEMEAMEKQLQSNKKFIDEQAQEREQEREDYIKELTKMHDIVREKDKIQSNEMQLQQEIESLEQQLRARIEDHQNAITRKESIEKELLQSMDKIRDLRDIIETQDKEIECKTKSESELNQKLLCLADSLSLKNKISSLANDDSKLPNSDRESKQRVENLKQQLASKNEEIEQMAQNQTFLKELRGQIHFLEAKVEKQARLLESLHMSSSSPVPSGDTSPSGSQGSEILQLPCEDGYEISPRSLHWLEIQHLEEKIGRLVHVGEEMVRKNKDLEMQMKKMKINQTEYEHENAVLQEKLSEQLLQISSLKSHIEEHRHKCNMLGNFQVSDENIEELREAFEKQLEKNKKLFSELQEAKKLLCAFREDVQMKDNIISSLQKEITSNNQHSAEIQASSNESAETTACYKLVLLEKNDEIEAKAHKIDCLTNEIEELKKSTAESMAKTSELKKENVQLKTETEHLRNEICSLREQLVSANTQLKIEKEQADKIFADMAALKERLKKLEQDYNVVQEMMQQKERELATLHEETDDQMQLEAEVAALEKELQHQKSVENQLKYLIEKLKSALEEQKGMLESLNMQWENKLQKQEETHNSETSTLKNQIAILHQNLSKGDSEDIDLSEVKQEIIEATKSFNSMENKAFEDLVYYLLKKAVDTKLQKIAQVHQKQTVEINKGWEHKISEELRAQKCNFESRWEHLGKENLLLKQRLDEQNRQKSLENENHFLKLHEKNKSLMQQLSDANRQSSSVQAKNEELLHQIQEMENSFQVRHQQLVQDLQEKLEAMAKQVNTSNIEVNRLREELRLKIEKERSLKAAHQEESSNLRKFFETRWIGEMEKIRHSQKEELRKLHDNKEKNIEALCSHLFAEYEMKLKNLQEEYNQKVMEERKNANQRHLSELEELQSRLERDFSQEKERIIGIKDQEIHFMEKHYKQKIAHAEGLTNPSDVLRNNWEAERSNLVFLHEKEMKEMRENLKKSFEKRLQAQLVQHSEQLKSMEQSFGKQVDEAYSLIKEAQHAAVRTYSGSRTETPSSEMSSDDACSSCQEDMLLENKNMLVNKIYQEGKKILAMGKPINKPSLLEHDARLWLEERKWIVDKVQSFNTDNKESLNLKLVITNLVEEVHRIRQNLALSQKELAETKGKCSQLEHLLNTERSQLYLIATNLSQQIKTNTELEDELNSRTSEYFKLKKAIINGNGYSSSISEGNNTLPLFQGGNMTTSSYDVGQLRSADAPKSIDRFSMFLPEPTSMNNKTQEQIQLSEREHSPLSACVDKKISLENRPTETSAFSKVEERLKESLDDTEGYTSNDAKLHGLFWIYKKSVSYNKSLVYQKKYLLKLLRGFLVTERMTLAWLDHMNEEEESPRSRGDDPRLRGRSLFKSVANVVIAIQRMKFCVNRWQQFAKVPSSKIVHAEIRTLVGQSRFLFLPCLSPDTFSSTSLSSKTTSVGEFGDHCSNNLDYITREERKSRVRDPPHDKKQLIEYVHRLQSLQRQLGLDNFVS